MLRQVFFLQISKIPTRIFALKNTGTKMSSKSLVGIIKSPNNIVTKVTINRMNLLSYKKSKNFSLLKVFGCVCSQTNLNFQNQNLRKYFNKFNWFSWPCFFLTFIVLILIKFDCFNNRTQVIMQVGATIANAVFDACGPRVYRIPVTPEQNIIPFTN